MIRREEHDVESLPKKRGSLENFTCQPLEQFSTAKWNAFITKQTGRRRQLSGEVSKSQRALRHGRFEASGWAVTKSRQIKTSVFRDVWALCEVFTQARRFRSGRSRRVTVSAGVRDEKLFEQARGDAFFYRSPQELIALFSTVFTLPTMCCRVKDNGFMETEQRKMEKRCSLWVLCKRQAEDIMSRCFDF